MKFSIRDKKLKFYHAIYVILVILMPISVVTSYSLTGEILRPVIRWIAAFAIVIGVSKVDYRFINRFAFPLLIVALALVCITLLFGSGGGGRSLTIGAISIQTFYIITIIVVLYLCTSCAIKITKNQSINKYESFNLLALFALFTASIALRNFSTALLLGFTGICILYVAKINMKQLVGFILIIVLGASLYIWHGSKEDQKRTETELNQESKTRGSTVYNRIKYWRTGESDIEGYGQQMTLAQTAVARSANAAGPGKGIIKNKMAEGENDFAFALICEELSVFTGIFLAILYFSLFFNALYISRKASGNFVKLYSMSIGLLILGQAMIHIATNTNLIPATGQTLPFISRGDTAFLFTCTLVGTLINMGKMVANNADDDSEFIVK